MSEPTTSRCVSPACMGRVAPERIVLTTGAEVWARGSYCPACTSKRAAPPAAPTDPTDAGPEPARRPCVNATGCGGTVGHLLVRTERHAFWTPDGTECQACIQGGRDAYRRERYEARLVASGLPQRYAGFRFDRVLVQKRDEPVAAFTARIAACETPHLGITPPNADIARELRAWRRGSRSLFLTGPVGGGKTTLMAALLSRLMWEDVSVLYLPEALLYDTVKKAMFAERGVKVPDLVAAASRCAVLALDDLGTVENLAPWQRNTIEQVVCARYDADLPIVITSNLYIEDMASLHGERVASRLSEMCGRRHLELIGHDWRTGKQHVAPASPAPKAPEGPKAVQTPLLPPAPTWSRPAVRDYKAAAAGERDDD